MGCKEMTIRALPRGAENPDTYRLRNERTPMRENKKLSGMHFKVRPTVLIVDDAPANLMLMNELLQDRYEIKLANNGRNALRVARLAPHPDLILLDVMMPEMDGYSVCRELKRDPLTAEIPVIFLTARTQTEDEVRGFSEGAVDYISKPINPVTLQARVSTHIQLKASREMLKDQNKHLAYLVSERTSELEQMQDAIILAMASLAEMRDNETGYHIRRTQHYVAAVARHLQPHPRFSAELSDENIALMYKSAALHDIGKVGVPDHILLKPGKLTRDEFEQMKMHTVYGRNTILEVEKYIGSSNAFLRHAREIAYSHQEKWDGSGYPEGLSGDAIPLSARLMAVADVYDALISRRVYKDAMSHEKALQIMRAGRGTHFDPDIIDAVVAIQDEFRSIALEYQDADECEPQATAA
jgi:putative two-component system response regulator